MMLEARVLEAPRFVAGVPELVESLKSRPLVLPRNVITTGIGTSEGHARHLAEAAARWLGQPARFVATGRLARGTPPNSKRDWLIVFSQGLCANALFALQHVEAWGGVVLVTGLGPSPSSATSPSVPTSAPDGDHVEPLENLRWLAELEMRGVIRVDLGCGTESGMLLRVIGARVGYAVSWSILRTLAWRRLEFVPALELDSDSLHQAQLQASLEAQRVFPMSEPIAPFFSPERSLILIAEGGEMELADQLSLKLAEGMLRPQPRCIDVLNFAHGPLQSLAKRPLSIIYLSTQNPDPEAVLWLARFRESLDPALHDLRVLCAQMPQPFAIIEYEAMLDDCVLRVLAETGGDIVNWPGANRDASLYGAGPRLMPIAVTGSASSVSVPRFEELVWPDVEALIEDGRRTAVIALGSIEQHGPHLPLGTDRFIADALAQGLAERRPDALALPALSIGCASEHLDFPGTLHIEPATLEAMLCDLISSLARHGFERAFIFTAHGGNVDALDAMRARVEAHHNAMVVRIETNRRVSEMQSRVVAEAGLAEECAGPHAGEFETSLVAMLRPGVVRRQALAPGRIVAPGEDEVLFYPSLRPNTETGVLGDPRRAAAERGERYLTAWIDLLEVAYVEALGAVSVGPTEKNRQ